ncbi:hypothetical protein ACEYW6_08005 [Nostoc sp. UIC 10607]|uniref:hypothetical protein n=1 Tax=Nostoc sp. UIC 10607 TaxID=3045935 RepID=UPI00399FADA1
MKVKIGGKFPSCSDRPRGRIEQFSVKMLLLSDFLGTIGLSDEKIISQPANKIEVT